MAERARRGRLPDRPEPRHQLHGSQLRFEEVVHHNDNDDDALRQRLVSSA
ncbi:hypothetical protein [Streptomyces lacrimifluminis]|nr:hypothetical protein [Streptomyces lacrimifluminis]